MDDTKDTEDGRTYRMAGGELRIEWGEEVPETRDQSE
jgi:hypothetical protein